MARILFLAHRLPYPPDKGDKVRSFHLLKHLTQQHEVHLGTFVDDPADTAHLSIVRSMCAGLHAPLLSPRIARLRSLAGLISREPLTLAYYRDDSMRRWVEDTTRRLRFDAAMVFSSAMAQFAAAGLPTFVDFVDVDSAKWTEYGARQRWPLSWIYQREGRLLLEYERRLAKQARGAYLVTKKEVALFESLAPDCAGMTRAVSNGVDAEYFVVDTARPTPFAPSELPVVFTGVMDYWPNVDAVKWFAAEALPALRRRWPGLRFHVVGRNPTPAVRALVGQGVNVTGAVPDVRPFLQHAAVVVAPLRLARGVQNKILEAMAMERPVVAASQCLDAIDAVSGRDAVSADSGEDYVAAISGLLESPRIASAIGASARDFVVSRYSWSARLRELDAELDQVVSPRGAEHGAVRKNFTTA
ncbi:MAG: TIGR03087 family PEP-CTERM/XrtA system glycosyltransferase [Burkholderiaceae bacterium]|nr:TIGR03087 family PEP-CTERM/XrtA system glycosyltransferase [Burkholderiaceae bacterium]